MRKADREGKDTLILQSMAMVYAESFRFGIADFLDHSLRWRNLDNVLEEVCMQVREFAKLIKICKAVDIRQEQVFHLNLHTTYPDAPLAPNYLDLRHVFRVPAIRMRIAQALTPFVHQANPDYLGDLPLSVSPIVTTLSDLTNIPILTIRSEALKGEKKDHGREKQILGRFEVGKRVMIFDDVISSFAFTKLAAIHIFQEAGLVVSLPLVVVVDREEGGIEILGKHGFTVRSLFGWLSILDYYGQAGFITERAYRAALAYARAAKEFALAHS